MTSLSIQTNMSQKFSLVPTADDVDANRSRKQIPPDASIYLRKRYYVTLLLFLGYTEMRLMNINLNICIVDLTANKTVTVGNATFIQNAEYDWTPPQKGLILSAIFWGNLASPLGAPIANKFGGIRTYGWSVLLSGLLTIFSPSFIQWSVYVFFFIRCIEGILHGVSIASAFTAFVKWVPPGERARLINFTLLGNTIGAAISYPIVGFIAHYLSWRYVFYLTGDLIIGGVAALWFILLYFIVENSPLEDRIITKAEKSHFQEVCEEVAQDKVIIPWKSLFTSIPVYAYWNDRFVEGWSQAFLLACLPLYIKDIHPSNIKDIGIISGIPHFFATFGFVAFSWLSDYLRSQENSSKTRLHKQFILIGQVPGACLFIIVGFWGNFYFAMIAFSIFKICFSAANASYYVLPMDMSLQHNNILISIGVAIKSIACIISPITLGFMVQNHLPEEWSRYFWFLSIFNLWGAIVFAIFGSGEVQPWAHSYKKSPRVE